MGGLAVAGLIESASAQAADDRARGAAAARNRKINEPMEASVKWYELLPNAEARTALTHQVSMAGSMRRGGPIVSIASPTGAIFVVTGSRRPATFRPKCSARLCR